MTVSPLQLQPGRPLIVGSIANQENLEQTSVEDARSSCDVVEIRLDLLTVNEVARKPWRKFDGIPLLFTAREASEGGAPGLSAENRMARLEVCLDDASLIDIELASAPSMSRLIEELQRRQCPWIASYHHFREVPAISELSSRLKAARRTGAAAFKIAVEMGWAMDQLAPLSLFLRSSPDYPVALMGMGPLAPVSRVLFGQLGSVLNYGYLGNTPTAPGQWSARQLQHAIESVKKPEPSQS